MSFKETATTHGGTVIHIICQHLPKPLLPQRAEVQVANQGLESCCYELPAPLTVVTLKSINKSGCVSNLFYVSAASHWRKAETPSACSTLVLAVIEAEERRVARPPLAHRRFSPQLCRRPLQCPLSRSLALRKACPLIESVLSRERLAFLLAQCQTRRKATTGPHTDVLQPRALSCVRQHQGCSL